MNEQSFIPPVINIESAGTNSLYNRLNTSDKVSQIENSTNTGIALICSDNKFFETLRKQLYKMPDHFTSIKLIDLGEIINQDHQALTKIQTILIEQNIIPIYLGFDKLIVDVLLNAQVHKDEDQHCCFLSSTLELYNKYAKSEHSCNIIPIGFQTQFCFPEQISALLPEFFEQTRLGKIRSDIHLAEPFLRQSNFHIFDMNVMRHSEVPDCTQAGPSGLFSEEICQLAKYTGLSDQLQSIAFLGLEELSHINSWNLVAQVIWYILLGLDSKSNMDDPENSNQIIHYTIESNAFDVPLHFVKSTVSGKWWVRHAYHEKKFIPCSYEDYLMSCQNEIPDRILSACFH